MFQSMSVNSNRSLIFSLRTHADAQESEDRRDAGALHRRGLGVAGLQHHPLPHLQRHHLLPLPQNPQPEQSRLPGDGPQSAPTRGGQPASQHQRQPENDPHQPRGTQGERRDRHPDGGGR